MNNLPPVTRNLLIINVLVFAATYVLSLRGIDLESLFALHYFGASNFQPWQFFTYMFMHGSITHLFFNMFALWMFGRIIENVLGMNRFIIYYMVCGLGAGVLQELAQYIEFYGCEMTDHAMSYGQVVEGQYVIINELAYNLNNMRTVGASGAVYGVLLAFGMLFPNERMFIIPIPFPIKAKYMVGGYALLELLLAMSHNGDGIAHTAHIGGMIFGYFLIRHWCKNNFSGPSLVDKIRRWWNDLTRPKMRAMRGGRFSDEMDYNARRKAQDEEIDRILDKVKAHGYGSLSESEKDKLFNAGGRR